VLKDVNRDWTALEKTWHIQKKDKGTKSSEYKKEVPEVSFEGARKVCLGLTDQ